MKTRTLLALAATCTALAACGGGGGDGGGTTTGGNGNTGGNGGVPQSAQSSVAGLITYLQSLIAGTNETAAPVSLEGVTLPVDDTAAPSAI